MLLFESMPRYSPAGPNGTLPDQETRIRVIHAAREEYFRIVDKLRIMRALCDNVPQDAERVYKVGDLFRKYREEKRSYSQPLEVIEVDASNRMVTVDMVCTNCTLPRKCRRTRSVAKILRLDF